MHKLAWKWKICWTLGKFKLHNEKSCIIKLSNNKFSYLSHTNQFKASMLHSATLTNSIDLMGNADCPFCKLVPKNRLILIEVSLQTIEWPALQTNLKRTVRENEFRPNSTLAHSHNLHISPSPLLISADRPNFPGPVFFLQAAFVIMLF